MLMRSILLAGFCASGASAQILLRPDTVLAADRTNNSLVQLDANTGQLLGSVQLPAVSGRTLEGFSLVGSSAFVSFSGAAPALRQIARVNLQTGSLFPSFAGANPVGLSSRDGDLLAINAVSQSQFSVQRFSVSGALLSTTPLSTFGTLGINEVIDDLAWDGTSLATVSTFRLPGLSSFQIYRWDADTGSPLTPGRTVFFPAGDLRAEGFDIAADGSYWFTFNPAPGAPGNVWVSRYDPASGAMRNISVGGSGALSDLVYVVPSPGVALALGVLAPSLARRRRVHESGLTAGVPGRLPSEA